MLDRPPLFLAKADILEYHSEQIDLYGGLHGIGDDGGLDSALAAPQNLFHYHEDASIFDIAAGYAFHISESQAFNDGNKRTGLQAAIVFLKGNGYSVETSDENLFESVIDLANRRISRSEFASVLQACSVRDGGLTAWIRTLFPG